jgi:hypothetical protein
MVKEFIPLSAISNLSEFKGLGRTSSITLPKRLYWKPVVLSLLTFFVLSLVFTLAAMSEGVKPRLNEFAGYLQLSTLMSPANHEFKARSSDALSAEPQTQGDQPMKAPTPLTSVGKAKTVTRTTSGLRSKPSPGALRPGPVSKSSAVPKKAIKSEVQPRP